LAVNFIPDANYASLAFYQHSEFNPKQTRNPLFLEYLQILPVEYTFFFTHFDSVYEFRHTKLVDLLTFLAAIFSYLESFYLRLNRRTIEVLDLYLS
jgi:hypothetical protein